MMLDEIQKTPRREAREGFARYILKNLDFEESDIDDFLNTQQAVLEGRSPLELIYRGEYERGMQAVYALADGLEDE